MGRAYRRGTKTSSGSPQNQTLSYAEAIGPEEQEIAARMWT
jgi:hypothetical protein